MDRDELITLYFNLGFTQKETLYFLISKHDILLSLRHLRRILKRLSLYRRQYSDIVDVAVFIYEKLTTSSQLHGYRWMHSLCAANGLKVSRDRVRLLLQILDPVGVDQRRRHRLQRSWAQFYMAHWFLRQTETLRYMYKWMHRCPSSLCVGLCGAGAFTNLILKNQRGQRVQLSEFKGRWHHDCLLHELLCTYVIIITYVRNNYYVRT